MTQTKKDYEDYDIGLITYILGYKKIYLFGLILSIVGIIFLILDNGGKFSTEKIISLSFLLPLYLISIYDLNIQKKKSIKLEICEINEPITRLKNLETNIEMGEMIKNLIKKNSELQNKVQELDNKINNQNN